MFENTCSYFVTALRFTFRALSVESPQDYIIFSNQPVATATPRLAVVSFYNLFLTILQ